MRSRSSSNVRVKIIALLTALAALWAFAAWVTVRDGINLLLVNTRTDSIGVPTEELVDALQAERRLSVVALEEGTDARQDALAEGRERTDGAIAAWRGSAGEASLRFGASDRLRTSIDDAKVQLGRIDELRTQVDEAGVDRHSAVATYTEVIDGGFAVYGSLSGLDDQEIARQASLLVTLSQARELLSRQDSLLAGALAAGELTQRDITEFTRLVGSQHHLYARTADQLAAADQAAYQAAEDGAEVQELRQLEEEIVNAAPGQPPFSAEAWRSTVEPAVAAMRDMELAAADNLVERATPVAAGVIVRLLLAGGLGLIAVLAAIIVSITTARNLVRQLERLRDAARDLATNRLPRVVDRLSVGERVDVSTEAPPLRFGDDEIGQVGQAFNSVQETAVRAAVQQADLRRGVRDVFLSLARRTQGLVHKQLGVLDTVERRVTDADEMEELFRIDHLATRMRRNAENLIVLSGASAGRAWRQPVAMIDVVRGALAEVEDYTRVNLLPVEDGALEGRVVGDVVHLLAELIENAASFSPPYAPVSVAGQRVAHGFAVEIEDRGLGMSDEELAAVNRQLADPPDFSLADASRLGHYVVAKLAQRHDIKVHLRPSPYGGVAAIVLVPGELLVEGDAELPTAGARPAPALAPTAANGAAGGSETAPVVRQRSEAVVASAQPEGNARPAAADTVPAPAQQRTEAEEAPAVVTAGEGVHRADEAPARTPSGLPWRVRQASLPRQLRDDSAAEAEPAAPEESVRDPEVVRRMMRAYQRGTQLGRSDSGSDREEG